MRKTGMAALLLPMAMMLTIPAVDAAEIRDISAEELAALLHDAGYRASVGRDLQDDPMVTSSAAGARYSILMYGCEQDRCKSLHFSVGFDLTNGSSLQVVNAWNRDNRYGNAWLDDENDPWLELDLDLEGGGTLNQVAEYIVLWDSLLGQFQTLIYQPAEEMPEVPVSHTRA